LEILCLLDSHLDLLAQTAFLRKQVEMTVEQAKDFQTVASKAAEDVSKPIKTAFEKAMKEVKAA
ncbi:MAG: phasin, partial [Mesorhizobium sp.]